MSGTRIEMRHKAITGALAQYAGDGKGVAEATVSAWNQVAARIATCGCHGSGHDGTILQIAAVRDESRLRAGTSVIARLRRVQ